MHDTLNYFKRDPIHRRYHDGDLTFRSVYQYAEKYLLPLSHDEVVHGKSSLIGRMPGDAWQKFANLRLLLVNQFTQPGKKLLFMGCEFGQWSEWNHDASLDWHLLEWPSHRGVQKLVDDLSRLYSEHPALFEGDSESFRLRVDQSRRRRPEHHCLSYAAAEVKRRGAGRAQLHPRRAPITASASPSAGHRAKLSTATPKSTGAAAREISANLSRRPCPITNGPSR